MQADSKYQGWREEEEEDEEGEGKRERKPSDRASFPASDSHNGDGRTDGVDGGAYEKTFT